MGRSARPLELAYKSPNGLGHRPANHLKMRFISKVKFVQIRFRTASKMLFVG